MPITRNANYPNTTLTNVIESRPHSCLEPSLPKVLSQKQKALDNGLYLRAKAFKFQINLVAMPSEKRKRNVVTIQTKPEITQ